MFSITALHFCNANGARPARPQQCGTCKRGNSSSAANWSYGLVGRGGFKTLMRPSRRFDSRPPLALQAIQIPNEIARNIRPPFLPSWHGMGLLSTYPGQFPGIQPITAAIWAFVHFHEPFGAEKMALQFHAFTPRTLAFAIGIHFDTFVTLDVQ